MQSASVENESKFISLEEDGIAEGITDRFVATDSIPVEIEPKFMPSEGDGIARRNSHGNKSRLRRACDSCSIRKVKCDESGPPCQACMALEIPCTYQRPTRRRGPPNRHAEAIKRKTTFLEYDLSPPSSTNSDKSRTSASAPLSAKSICPWPLLSLLVDDYFTYVHPLIPFPHEPSFRTALQGRDDVRDPKTLALLAAMIAALVASFPRKPRQHLKALRNESLFPSSISLVERCHNVAAEARGPGYLNRDTSLFDAFTSHLLALSLGYTFQLQQTKLYLSECQSILRTLGYHKAEQTAPGAKGSADGGAASQDFITQEMGRRAFWSYYVGARSIQQLGGSLAEFYIPPETATAPYPPLPLEVDDHCILSDRILPQPAGIVSVITGFNANVRVYQSYDALNIIDLSYGTGNSIGWDWQRMMIQRALGTCRRALDGLPPELKLTPNTNTLNFGPSSCVNAAGPNRYFSGGAFAPDPASPQGDFNEARRRKQYGLQKANVYISQLGTRSHIVEKYWSLHELNHRRSAQFHNAAASIRSQALFPQNMTEPRPGMEMPVPQMANAAGYSASSVQQGLLQDPESEEMEIERGHVIRDLLMVLSSISRANMEANGASVIFKIRMMASTLLDVPRTRKGALALQADEYLAHFLDILMKLERDPAIKTEADESDEHSGASNAANPEMDAAAAEAEEEAELGHWANLREYQERFMKSGGFFA